MLNTCDKLVGICKELKASNHWSKNGVHKITKTEQKINEQVTWHWGIFFKGSYKMIARKTA